MALHPSKNNTGGRVSLFTFKCVPLADLGQVSTYVILD